MSGRRTDTRERIQQVALELFAERGYEKTSLREVADRLKITRPALYYHFATKEDILTSVVDDLTDSIDELVDWARAQPHTDESRREILRRISTLLSDQWRPLIQFSQVNQAAIGELRAGERMRDRMLTLVSLLGDPESDLVEQFEARLAVVAVLLGSAPVPLGMETTGEQRSAIALEVASKLIARDR